MPGKIGRACFDWVVSTPRTVTMSLPSRLPMIIGSAATETTNALTVVRTAAKKVLFMNIGLNASRCRVLVLGRQKLTPSQHRYAAGDQCNAAEKEHDKYAAVARRGDNLGVYVSPGRQNVAGKHRSQNQ